jgi:hypothetical protein
MPVLDPLEPVLHDRDQVVDAVDEKVSRTAREV